MLMQLPSRRNSFRLAATAAVAALAALAPAAGAVAATGAPHTAASGTRPAAHPDGGGQYVRTVKLADGVSIGKIYKLGEHHFRMEGFTNGSSFGSIEAGPARPYAAGNLNGMITALDNNGNVVSWIQRSSQGGGPHTEKLADGETVAKVSRLGPQRHKATLSLGGHVLGSVEAPTGDAPYGVTRIGGLWVVLDIDGGIASYVGPADPDRCTVTSTINSLLPTKGMTVELTNRPVPASGPNGPQAILKDKNGTVITSINFNHPENTEWGLKMTDTRTGHPKLLDRRPKGTSAPRVTPFPALPKGCPTGA
ncbi:hypothetical protein [Streptomyces nigrescens]|uniref:Secreted protein n=2 Tax=Streptomyces nigrescens TaxID=1920 RepID=A0ABY7IKQ5_STRNI|nr:hypothetical protein [Streptomyces libani]WAT99259.1 hypothetical protein STRLI_005405 [Streptomyces libani subsp. libani]